MSVDDELTVAYMCGYEKGKEMTAQERAKLALFDEMVDALLYSKQAFHLIISCEKSNDGKVNEFSIARMMRDKECEIATLEDENHILINAIKISEILDGPTISKIRITI